MHYYKATIQYDGTDYSGFQWQQGVETVQSAINAALARIHPGKISTAGASRTDAGVHAVDQRLKMTTEWPFECASFLPLFNDSLPAQIRCLDLAPCEGSYNPISHTVSKEYRYLFANTGKLAGADRRFVSNIANPLDDELMQACTQLVVGTHDFKNFVSTGSNVRSTIRDVRRCLLSTVVPQEIFPSPTLFQMPPTLTSCYQLEIAANGFLKQMIRHLVAALWMVGSKKLSLDEFEEMLQGPLVEKRRWKVASPRGLFLYKITEALP
jgi:tRNA pseudouridine38-40 synthase